MTELGDLAAVEYGIGYQFVEPELAWRALTHRSAGRAHNERLEYLGDAALGLFVAETLYEQVPGASEGELTRARARLVRQETLAATARELGLGRALRLGPGERKSGGRERDSILADAVEALIGAVYLDGGFEAARGVVQHLLQPRVSRLLAEGVSKNPKTRLQEYLQSRKLALPTYELVEVEGSGHRQRFTAQCAVPELTVRATGRGSSRRGAEQAAADSCLELIDGA